jgi:hypothetical protein
MTTSGATQRRLSPYEQARLDKIKRNETRLASLGLLNVKKQLTTTPRRRQETRGGFRRANNSVVTPSPPSRTSGRLKSQTVQYAPLVDDGRLKKKHMSNMESSITPNTKKSFKCDIPMNVSSLPLTKDEKYKIESKMKSGDDEFLAAFEDI